MANGETPGTPSASDPASPQSGRGPSKDEKMWGMLAHLSAIVLGFVGPLVIWLIKREEMPFVNDQGKEALNFQITVAIAFAAGFVISFIPFVGCFVIPAVWIANIVMVVMAGLKANDGVAYRYPVILRLIK